MGTLRNLYLPRVPARFFGEATRSGFALSGYRAPKEGAQMERRRFLAGAIVGVFGVTPSARLLAANDPPVNDWKQSNLTVGDPAAGGGLSNIQRINVWEMNLEEDDDVRFYFRLTNNGPREVRLVHCQPWAADSWARKEVLGPFGTVNAHDFHKSGWAPNGWRADNDSNAFYFLIKNGDRWDVVQGRTKGWGDRNTAHMEWYEPQEIRFEVRSIDKRR